jgi:hypothetical protein
MQAAKRLEWESRVGVQGMRPVASTREHEPVEYGSAAGSLRTRDHAAIVYFDASELLDTVVPYLVEGLRVGDKVVYVADDQPVEAVTGALGNAGIDVEAELAAGRLVVLTAAQAFYPEGRFDVEAALNAVQELAAAAERDGFRRVRFSVEMTYLLADVPGMERGPEFESRANEEVFARFPFVCICSFNGERGTTQVLEDVLATHPILLSKGLPLVNPYYRPWSELALKRSSHREPERSGLAASTDAP